MHHKPLDHMMRDGRLARVGEADPTIVDLFVVARQLWRGKWIIAASTLIAVALGGYYAFGLAQETYRSTATIVLDTREEMVVDLQSVVGRLGAGETQLNTEVEVLQSRGLAAQVVDQLDLINDPVFNGRLAPPTGLAAFEGQVRNLFDGLFGQEDAPLVMEDTGEMNAQIRFDVTRSLMQKVTVRNVPTTYLFHVTVESSDPRKSALVANTLVELYIRDQIQTKFNATEQATDWLSGRVAELGSELAAAEQAVADFNTSKTLVSTATLAAQETHLKELRATIAAQEDRGISNDLTALKAEEARLARAVQRGGEDQLEVQQLAREVQAVRVLYEYFLGRLKEATAQQGIQRADSRILSPAITPSHPASPQKARILALCLTFGVILGSALVLVRGLFSRGFSTPHDLAAATGLRVFGAVPKIPVKGRARVLRYLLDRPTSAVAEAVRGLRTSIEFTAPGAFVQVIGVTSAHPDEGKTTAALALAHSFGALGRRVLYIEGDLRRRVLGEYFPHMRERGLVALLEGNATPEDVIVKAHNGFAADLLPGDAYHGSPADLLAMRRFGELIDDLRRRYDIIILDTPPLLAVPDARIMLQDVDRVLLGVEWSRTNKEAVAEALERIDDIPPSSIGLFLSRINPKKMRAYAGRRGYDNWMTGKGIVR
ncbi:polysaccharide biosynthesis tyrosine autokinase [Celeribacter arenosi]